MNLIKKMRCWLKIAVMYFRNKKISLPEIREDYNMLSNTYDSFWIEKMSHHTVSMLENMQISEKAKILDLACGTGFISNYLSNKYPRSVITAVDISEEMIAKARNKSGNKNIEYHTGDMIDFLKNIGDEMYELITIGWAIVYVNQKELFPLLHRALKPNGQLAIIVNRKGTIKNIEKSFYLIMEQYPEKIEKINDICLTLPKGYKSLKRDLCKLGFKDFIGGDSQQTFSFTSYDNAVDWIYNCGALAGNYQLLKLDNLKNEIKSALIKMNKNRINPEICHKFTVIYCKKDS